MPPAQWLFLQPLDARILLAHYGSYGALPGSVTAKVVDIDAVTQSEAARRKMKFLGHLPLTGAAESCRLLLLPGLHASSG
jgi:hypothetical protein